MITSARGLAIALTILPIVAIGAETGPAADYPSFRRVGDFVAAPPEVGARISVFGLPRCTTADECVLISDQGEAQRSTIRFDRSALAGDDKARLFHCYDPAREKCIAVIYGIATPTGLAAKRIWWRSLPPS